jgi:hypothetical protein
MEFVLCRSLHARGAVWRVKTAKSFHNSRGGAGQKLHRRADITADDIIETRPPMKEIFPTEASIVPRMMQAAANHRTKADA